MLSIEDPAIRCGVGPPATPRRAGARRRRLGLALTATGLLTVLVATVGLVADGTAHPAPRPTAFAGAISVHEAIYEPGQSTGWHRHEGVHVVTVTSGFLTVDDGSAAERTYGAGETYVGGRELHVARNQGDVPVRMVVTYVLDGREGWSQDD